MAAWPTYAGRSGAAGQPPGKSRMAPVISVSLKSQSGHAWRAALLAMTSSPPNTFPVASSIRDGSFAVRTGRRERAAAYAKALVTSATCACRVQPRRAHLLRLESCGSTRRSGGPFT